MNKHQKLYKVQVRLTDYPSKGAVRPLRTLQASYDTRRNAEYCAKLAAAEGYPFEWRILEFELKNTGEFHHDKNEPGTRVYR